jgi:hypothetical protein
VATDPPGRPGAAGRAMMASQTRIHDADRDARYRRDLKPERSARADTVPVGRDAQAGRAAEPALEMDSEKPPRGRMGGWQE